jgi:hypothetical protein
MEREYKNLWPIIIIWFISVLAIATGIDSKMWKTFSECESFIFCALPSLLGKLLAASSIGIIGSGIFCLIIKKWRNAYSHIVGAIVINVLFFAIFILG